MPPRLTDGMREALLRGRKGALRRVHDVEHGKPPWPVHPCSLAACVNRGLLVRSERRTKRGHRLEEWTLTDEGREALNPRPLVRRDAVRSLRVPGGSTRMMQRGDWVDARMPEPEPVHPDEVDAAWFGQAAERHAEARDRRDKARRMAAMRKAA